MDEKQLLDANFITKMGLDYIKNNKDKFEDILNQNKNSNLSEDIRCILLQKLVEPTKDDQELVDIFMLTAAYLYTNDCNLNRFVHFSSIC